MPQTFWKKILTIILVSLIGVFSFSVKKEYDKNKQIQSEVTRLEDQIAVLEEEKNKLASLTSFFETESFKEREIKRQLGLQKPEEKVIVITESKPTREEQKEPNIEPEAKKERKWWEIIFGR